jgi:hypothetical protein
LAEVRVVVVAEVREAEALAVAAEIAAAGCLAAILPTIAIT